MSLAARRSRLNAEHAALAALAAHGGPFSFTSLGDPPDRYTFIFRGASLQPEDNAGQRIVAAQEQRCDVWLPVDYPASPPDLRWLTPIWHPNVGLGGVMYLRDIGLPDWDGSAGLDVICECLWDVARFAYVDLDHAVNPAARDWLRRQTDLLLPLDPRPLRTVSTQPSRNVIRYMRRGEPAVNRVGNEELLVLGGDPPSPPLPRSPRPEIWFVGDE
jgi:hypothetical protein